MHVYLLPLVVSILKYSNKVTSLTFLQRTNVIMVNLEKKKVSCWRAPAQISYLLISSGQGQEVRQRRDVACWHCGAQGPTRRQSSRLQFSVISSPSAAEGWCRSHSTVCTQMHTQSRYAEEYKTQHRQGILTKLRKGWGWLHTHIK